MQLGRRDYIYFRHRTVAMILSIAMCAILFTGEAIAKRVAHNATAGYVLSTLSSNATLTLESNTTLHLTSHDTSPPLHEQLAALQMHSNSLWEQGKYTEYEVAVHETLAFLYSHGASNSLAVAHEYHNLGIYYSTIARYHDALAPLKRALDIKKDIAGTLSDDYLLTLATLAMVNRHTGRPDTGQQLIEHAIHMVTNTPAVPTQRIAFLYRDAGILCKEQGHYRLAEYYFTNALAYMQTIPHISPLHRAEVLSSLTITCLELGAYERCDIWCIQLDALRDNIRKLSPEMHADVCNTLGVIALHRGEFADAVSYCQTALNWYENAWGSNHLYLVNVHNNIAAAQRRRAQFARAEYHYLRAKDILSAHPDGDPQQHARINFNLAQLLLNQHRYFEAERLLLHAHSLYQNSAATGTIAYISLLNSLGKVAYMQEAYEAALAWYEKSESIIHNSLEPSHALIGAVAIKMARVHAIIGNQERAENLLKTALAHRISTLGNAHYRTIETRQELALWMHNKGAIDEALALIQTNLQLVVNTADTNILHTLNCATALAELYHNKGDIDSAKRYADMAHDIATHIFDTDTLTFAHILYTKAQIARENKIFDTAFSLFDDAINALENISEVMGTEGHANTLRAQQKTWIDAYCDIVLDALAAGTHTSNAIAPRLFLHTERARARTILAHLGIAAARTHGGLSPEEITHEHHLRKHLIASINYSDELRNTPLSLRKKDELLIIETALKNAKSDWHEYHMFLDNKYPRYAALRRSAFTNVNDLLSDTLLPHEALISYWLTPSHIHAFVAHSQGISHNVLPTSPNDITCDILNLHTAITGRAPHLTWAPLSHALYTHLVAPLTNTLSNTITTLYIVPDGILAQIPFDALVTHNSQHKHADTRYLSDQFQCIYLPSAAALKTLRQTHSTKRFTTDTRAPLLMFTAPLFTSAHQTHAPPHTTLPALKDAHDTALSVAEMFHTYNAMPVRIIHGADATKHHLQRLNEQGALRQYRIIHFDTHGTLPRTSHAIREHTIAMAYDNGNNEFLSLNDIIQWDLDADIVMLLACHSGAPPHTHINADTPALVRAFMYAGAARVCASLWPLSDAAAREFTTLFYTDIAQGTDVDTAMRNARKKLRATPRFQHPFYWAPLIQFGDGS